MKRFIILQTLLIFHLFSISQTGNNEYTHEPSGTVFSKSIGEFIFLGTKNYDDKGFDIGVGYRSKSDVELTQYIYPATAEGKPVLTDEEFTICKKSITAFHENANPISEGDIIVNSTTGKLAKYSFRDKFHNVVQSINSYLYIFEYKGWFIKLRITFKDENVEAKDKEIGVFLSKIPWPVVERKN